GLRSLGDKRTLRSEPLEPRYLLVHDLGVFELDGNSLNNPAVPGDDAADIYNHTSSALVTGFFHDPTNGPIFDGGGSKDDHDIPDWAWKDGSVSDKNDILDGFAASYATPAGLVAYGGVDRFANNGDAELGVWFFQDPTVSVQPNGTFSGHHV